MMAVAALAIVVVFASAACVRPDLRTRVADPSTVDLAELWEEPADLSRRDLLTGPGGTRLAPAPDAVYTFEEADTSGYSQGYVVKAPDGRRWSVKLGPEAQSEVAASRILWALGYHQPAVYYLPKWTMNGKVAGAQGEGRFRFDDPQWKVAGEWSWYDNAFVNTRPFKGLVVANLILNNWDWKTSNNKIVQYRENGSTGRLYVVRDLGASLGRTTFPSWLNLPLLRMWKQGSRNNVADFESQDLIKRVDGERVEFDYRGVNGSLVESVRPADVVWTCRLLSRLTDRQLADAFRAAGYTAEERARFVKKLKSKVAEGLALSAASSD